MRASFDIWWDSRDATQRQTACQQPDQAVEDIAFTAVMLQEDPNYRPANDTFGWYKVPEGWNQERAEAAARKDLDAACASDVG